MEENKTLEETEVKETIEVEETAVEETAGGADAPADNTSAPENEAPSEDAAIAADEEEETTGDFAKLLEESGAGQVERPPKMGAKISCKVVSVSGDWVFVNYGGKSEGSIARGEFAPDGEAEDNKRDEAGRAPLPKEGDVIEAYLLSNRDGETRLTTRLSSRDLSKQAIQDAFVAGVPVEGRVSKAIKGGFEVRVSGLRAFCPLSQIDIRWPRDPEVHVGKIYSFKVSEYKEKGRNIIVSRRALMEEEQVTIKEELKKRIIVGQIVTGHVRNVQPFGAFVELGGVDGLIPVSEMAWDRVEDPKEVLSEGQEVSAKVISADWEKERISLSLKALQEDPWVSAAGEFNVGEKVKGQVVRLTNFGAFVSLAPGVDGMIHVSALPTDKRVKHPGDVLSVGEEVEAEVLSVDLEKRRISLSMEYKLFEGMGALPSNGAVLIGTVEKVADFGVFLKLPSGHVGLIPNAEMNTRRGANHSQMFKPGDELEVKVLGIEERGRKIRLSIKALVRAQERELQKEYETYKDSGEGSMGTMADLFKAAQQKED